MCLTRGPLYYYVFVTNQGDGYLCGQVGSPTVANGIPISLPYPSMALAHDNMMQRQHMPLHARQRGEIELLQATYGIGGAKGTPSNQAFFNALLKENRWAAGETRPGHQLRQAVLAIITPPKVEVLLERTVGVGGSAPRAAAEAQPPRNRKRRQVAHDRT